MLVFMLTDYPIRPQNYNGSLAIAVIGGLSVSTLFTLIVAPVLSVSLDGLTRRGQKNAGPTPKIGNGPA